MKRFLICMAVLTASLTCRAQVDTLYLSDIYTTHIRYSTEITYVDISSTENVVAKVIEQNKNVLAIRARNEFRGYSSLTVIENNEDIHTYIISFQKSPARLVIDSYKVKKGPVGSDGTTASLTTMAAVEKAVAKGDISTGEEKQFTLTDAMSLPKSIYHLSDKSYDITCAVDNIIIYRDMIYVVMTLQNNSGMTYNCPDAAFVIESRKTNKKSIGGNEKTLYFRNSSGNLSCAAGKSTRVAYSFDNFTILKEQCLRIYINEMGGQRELCIPVEYKDINKAQIWH